ncbi:MAG: hypothetical protein ACOZBL_05175 [Patescibacteria group bacterium]
MSKLSKTNSLSPHFLNQITGTHNANDSRATNPKVSRNLDGTTVK